MNKSLFFIVISLIFGLLITLNIISNIFKSSQNYIIIWIFTIGLFFNLGIYCFIHFYYSRVDLKDGPPGPKGEPGIKGPRGLPDSCIQCEPVKKNLGQKKVEFDKKNKMIFKIPKIPIDLPGRPA